MNYIIEIRPAEGWDGIYKSLAARHDIQVTKERRSSL